MIALYIDEDYFDELFYRTKENEFLVIEDRNNF